MTEQKYELAFYGKLAAGATLEETKEQVALLFKTGIDQIERMFTGNRVVIRNKLDADTALKYIVALKKRGALCQVEEMGFPGVVVDLSKVLSDTPSSSSASESSSTQQTASFSSAPPSSSSQTNSSIPSPHQATKSSQKKAGMSVTGLPIVGDKVDDILSDSHFDLAPVGSRIGDKKQEVVSDLHALDDVSLAPVGSILAEKRDAPPVSVPDTSHLTLSDKDQ